MKNMISIGHNCRSASALKFAKLRLQSLPFDYLRTPLPVLSDIMVRLNQPSFNLDEFVADFFQCYKWPHNNKYGVFIGHFVKQLNVQLQDPKDTLYSVNKETLEMFKRRFIRLANMFYTQENILIFNDFEVTNEHIINNNWNNALDQLIKLNTKNTILHYTYIDRQGYTSNSQIETIRFNFQQPIYNNDLMGCMITELKTRFKDINSGQP